VTYVQQGAMQRVRVSNAIRVREAALGGILG
jgi:hypothetical protein